MKVDMICTDCYHQWWDVKASKECPACGSPDVELDEPAVDRRIPDYHDYEDEEYE